MTVNSDKVPQPIIAAAPIPNTIRQLFEECQNSLDSDPKANSVTELWELPQGPVMLTCKKTKTGKVSITIKMATNYGD